MESKKPDKPEAPVTPEVVVAYSFTGEDPYELLQGKSAEDVGRKPGEKVDVPTDLDEYRDLVRAIRKAGYVTKLYNLKDDIQRLERLVRRKGPRVIFNLVESFEEDPTLEAAVAGTYELHGVPYTGAGTFALTICQRKGLTKQILLAEGIPTPRYRLQWDYKIPRTHGLRYPLIVKPAREDASSGVEKDSVVRTYPALKKRLKWTWDNFDQPYLVEEFIEGRELHVSVLGNDPPRVLPILEYDFSKAPADYPHIVSSDVKWNPLSDIFHKVDERCPAKLPKRTAKRVEEIALKAYRVTGCRDYARLDVRLSKSGTPYVLEVNPNPDLSEGISFMRCAEKAGMEFHQVLGFIVECAWKRRKGYEERRSLKTTMVLPWSAKALPPG